MRPGPRANPHFLQSVDEANSPEMRLIGMNTTLRLARLYFASAPVPHMHRLRSGLRLLMALAVLAIGTGQVRGQGFADPGFESYAVSSGGFVQPSSGAWAFVNDAGVVEPPAPNSSTAPGNTWSATFAAFEGQQYASTYAGSDTIRQSVSFSAAGDYRISVQAAAPNGSLIIPTVGTLTLGNGQFTFTLGNSAIGNVNTVTAGTSWNLYTADFTIATPGSYQLGVRNSASSPYFINYDAFAIQPVPEPQVWGLIAVLGAVIAAWKTLRACLDESPRFAIFAKKVGWLNRST